MDLKILVIGCGSIGTRHAANFNELAKTAIVDSNSERAKQCGEYLGLQAFFDLETALDWNPDGVVIATPNHTHLQIASKVLAVEAHILIEKPLSHNLDNVDKFLENVQSRHKKVYVACNLRFHPGVSTLKQFLKTIGKPLFARAHYGNYLPDMRPNVDYRNLYCAHSSQGGGVIRDAIHEIDYLSWFFGDIQEVSCQANRLSNLEIDVEDWANLCVRHRLGVYSEVHLDYLRRFKRRGCEIVGTEGLLIWTSEGKNPESCRVELYKASHSNWRTLYEDKQLDGNAPYRQMAEHFMELISGQDVPELLTVKDAAQSLKVAIIALNYSQSCHNRIIF